MAGTLGPAPIDTDENSGREREGRGGEEEVEAENCAHGCEEDIKEEGGERAKPEGRV